MIVLAVLIVTRVHLVMVATDHVVSTEILALHVLIVTRVHRVMAMTGHVVSTGILALHVLIVTRVHLVIVMIVLAVLIATRVHRVMVVIDHVVSIGIHVLHVIVMTGHVALTVMIVLVVSIATTVHHALQRKIVQMKYAAALVNVVHPEKCHHHQSVHAKSGLMKVQFVQSVNQMWVAFAQRAQVVHKKADVKKCVLLTPLLSNLSVH
jgi:hypothetical protein